MRKLLIVAAVFGLTAAGTAFAGDPPAPMVPPNVQPIVLASHNGGCSSCGGGATSAAQSRWQNYGGTLKNLFVIGQGCPNPVTCGSFSSERTFLWGSCRQFHNPGNDCGPRYQGIFSGFHNGWGHGANRDLGTGVNLPHTHCVYGSFHNY
jgi:hypothetical protein